jgi:hypothetical protein
MLLAGGGLIRALDFRRREVISESDRQLMIENLKPSRAETSSSLRYGVLRGELFLLIKSCESNTVCLEWNLDVSRSSMAHLGL